MALAVEAAFPIKHTYNLLQRDPAMSSARLPGYNTGFGSINSSRRSGAPVGPNPLPKRLGSLAKGRTHGSSLSPRQPPIGVSAANVRIVKQSNSAGTTNSAPKAFDRNLNNVKPIRGIKGSHDDKSSSSNDTKPDSGSTNSSHENGDSKRPIPAALSVDFIKHALSSSKQIYSAQEIAIKRETSWKPSNKTNARKTRPKASSPTKDPTMRITPKEPPKSKLIDNIKNEGFAPRVKTHVLTNQLKILRQRLGGDNCLTEESEMDEQSTHEFS